MRHWIVAGLFPFSLFAQSPMDAYRWYLAPNGQEVLVSIDDLHDERLEASEKMDWGRALVPGLLLTKDVTIAVIDGGLDIEHPELREHIAYNPADCYEGTTIPPKDAEDKDNNGYNGDCAGWNFVEGHNRVTDLDGHGTHVTGIMRSVLAGVQGSVKFLPLNVFAPGEGVQGNPGSVPLPVRLTKAFEYALARQVDVIHLSVGWPRSFMTPELSAIIQKAIDRGVAVVSAAGNSSQRATVFPCRLEGVICVGALRANGEVARFSNRGSQVDIYAPGEKILSTIPYTIPPRYLSRKGYDFKNGTSQAAPFISAVMALLRGRFPQASLDELHARLMLGAEDIVGGLGSKGLFHLDRSLKIAERPFIVPRLKGLQSVVLETDGSFVLTMPFKNSWQASGEPTATSLTCKQAQIHPSDYFLPPLGSGEQANLSYTGRLHSLVPELDCDMVVGDQLVAMKLKVLHPLPAPFKTLRVKQEQPLVTQTRLGVRSRFLTVNGLKNQTLMPLYYLPGKEVALFHEDKRLGVLPIKKDCTFLRIWQIDFDRDGINQLMLETMCENSFLRYQFLNLTLDEVYPSTTLKPSLTILNYDDFQIIPQLNAPPIFRFTAIGLAVPTDTPWDTDVSSRENHLYELRPMRLGDDWKLEPVMLEDPRQWMKSLGLRYTPSYQVLHYVKGRLLIRIGAKTAWVDVATQLAQWAGLDDILWQGSQKQPIWGSDGVIFQSMLTAYEYRGFVLNGVKLRFKQEDLFDPLLDILGTQKNIQGHLTVLRTFQHLIYLQYDEEGRLQSKKIQVVDRFDFLTTQDLIASVINIPLSKGAVQIVDGTRINTDYIDVIAERSSKSYQIPKNCVTQQAIEVGELAVLPLFCAQTASEFEMRFIQL